MLAVEFLTNSAIICVVTLCLNMPSIYTFHILHLRYYIIIDHGWKLLTMFQGQCTYDVHENCSIFKTSHLFYPSTSRILPRSWPWMSNFKQPPPSPNDNKSIKRKQSKDDYYMLSDISFRSAFVSSISSLILPNLWLLFIYLKPHYLLFHVFILLCEQLNITKCFEFLIVHIFSTHFAINLFYLQNLKK